MPAVYRNGIGADSPPPRVFDTLGGVEALLDEETAEEEDEGCGRRGEGMKGGDWWGESGSFIWEVRRSCFARDFFG